MLPETYFITCKLIDLTIQKSGCKQQDLHKMSLGCLLIAMKYEEIYPPSLKNIIRAASRDPEFTQQDIVKWEFLILKTLDFNVTFPTPYRFLMRIQKLVNADELTFNLAHYIAEFSLLHVVFQTINPSLVASGAMYLARSSLNRRPCWNITFSKSTGYTNNIVLKVATKLFDLITAEESKTLKAKFENQKYLEAGLTPIVLNKTN
jgi:hypothetical protein